MGAVYRLVSHKTAPFMHICHWAITWHWSNSMLQLSPYFGPSLPFYLLLSIQVLCLNEYSREELYLSSTGNGHQTGLFELLTTAHSSLACSTSGLVNTFQWASVMMLALTSPSLLRIRHPQEGWYQFINPLRMNGLVCKWLFQEKPFCHIVCVSSILTSKFCTHKSTFCMHLVHAKWLLSSF